MSGYSEDIIGKQMGFWEKDIAFIPKPFTPNKSLIKSLSCCVADL
jgi:hypothetical protein